MELNVRAKINPAYIEHLSAKQRTQIFFGGSSSGKSYFIAQKAVLENMDGANYLCCRNVARTIRNSTFNEILKAIEVMGLSSFYRVHQSDMSITNTINGKQILFAGIDDAEKLKSITPANGVLERIFIEEATEIKREAYKQLTKRLRGNSAKSKQIILAFNPILQTHWIYKEFFGEWQDNKTVYKSDALLIVKTTHKDNLFLTEADHLQLENETDKYFYDVYTLGNWGVLGKVVFRNWRVEDLSEHIPHFANVYNGLDFGFSEDPNALIRVNVDQAQKKIYVFDEMYKTGMLNDELAEELQRRVPAGQHITCDCAAPQNIAELNARGIHAIPAIKGQNSVNFGIQWLQGYEIIIDVRCQNFKNEIQAYHWQEDKYGNALQKPADKDNHLIDALRYATEELQLMNRVVAVGRI